MAAWSLPLLSASSTTAANFFRSKAISAASCGRDTGDEAKS